MRFLIFILILFPSLLVAQSAQDRNRISLRTGLQRCLDGLGDPIENCFTRTNINGELIYIDSSEMADMFSDSDLLKFGTTTPASNIDTAYRFGSTAFGADTLVFYGNSKVSIDGHGSHSCLDLSIDNDIYSMRVKHDEFDCPLMYIDGRGAIYTASQVVISSAFQNSGYGCQLQHPSLDQFMLGIRSDVNGAGIQIHQSSALGSYQIGSLDINSDYRWMLEADGKMRWGLDSIQDMDTDFFRADVAKLFTSGTIGIGLPETDPVMLAAYDSDGYLAKAILGDGFSFVFDTLNFDASDDDWYKVGGLTPDDNTQIIYHNGGVLVGNDNIGNATATFNSFGLNRFGQSVTVNNIFFNGGNLTATGNGNIAFGTSTALDITTGTENILFGTLSGTDITSGARNIGMGYSSLLALTTGNDNFGLGTDALRSITTQSNNVAIGARALYGATTSNNVAIGTEAAFTNSAGTEGVYIGFGAGASSTGDYNTIIGSYAGYDAAGYCIQIGRGAGYSNTTASRLFISSYNWANATQDYENSIISGTMDATPSSQILNLNAKVLPRYMGGTATSMIGKDASGYLTTFSNNTSLSFSSGILGINLNNANTWTALQTFTVDPIVPDEAWSGLWDNVNEPVTKNAMFDYLNNEITSGIYSISANDEINADGRTLYDAYWTRINNIVTVTGGFLFDPTTDGLTSFEINLPFASDLGDVFELSGTGSSGELYYGSVQIRGETTNDTAEFIWMMNPSEIDFDSHYYSYKFTYIIN